MTVQLYQIADANLISARLYGIELDVEESRASFERYLDGCAAGPARRAALHGELHRFEDSFLAVLVHQWPEPDDPVVKSLRELAKNGMVRLARCRDLLSGCSLSRRELEQQESC